MFDTVLVANRGEIAVRIIRTLRRLGIRSAAVYSDADAAAPHVQEADTARHIGGTAATDSYLDIERLLAAAAATGAQAVHPGYGFLAENAGFARAVSDASLTFIGPPATAIALMGDKIRAKETVRAAGVPVVPGSSASGLTDTELIDAARDIGMPVLLKPAAGGGGKGMRLIRSESQLADAIAGARREARGSFGDDTLLVERWIDRPRHIEIQVLADDHGGVVHLGERECSLQRRHQKIIEEAPSPLLDPTTRAAMGSAAVEAARSCGYRGAGTVEFIVPGEDPSGYCFMEMNTRLQVEHPVTELVTGTDLVEEQLRIAAGEPIGDAAATAAAAGPVGHAIEARVCAETVRAAPDGRTADFLPSAGTVLRLSEPDGPGIRVDSGIREGTEVGTSYDSMLAKIIAHGPDRPSALRRLRAALAATTILGVDTTTGFLRRLLDHPAVRSGELDTGLVDRDAAGLLTSTVGDAAAASDTGVGAAGGGVTGAVPTELYAAAALLRQAALEPEPDPAGWTDPFDVPSGWRLGGDPAWTPHVLRAAGQDPVIIQVRGRSSDALVRIGDDAVGRPARLLSATPGAPPDTVRLELDGTSSTVSYATESGGSRWLGLDGDVWRLHEHDPVAAAGSGRSGGADALTATMPGTVTTVTATVGDRVTAGQTLLIVEAMKMEHLVAAPHPGTVTAVEVRAGDTVAMDQVLAAVDPVGEASPEPVGQPTGGPETDTGTEPGAITQTTAVRDGVAPQIPAASGEMP